MTRHEQESSRTALIVVWTVGVLMGVVVGLATSDVILGVIAGASFVAIAVGLRQLWTGGSPKPRHP